MFRHILRSYVPSTGGCRRRISLPRRSLEGTGETRSEVRRMIGTILVCMAVAGLAAAAAGVARATPSLEGPGTIRLTDRLVNHIHVRVAKTIEVNGKPKERSRAGDLDLYRHTLQTRSARPVTIGHSDIT